MKVTKFALGRADIEPKMKSLLTRIAALTLALSSFAADDTPTMPSEITLTSGRVLRNVSVIRWEKDRVVVRHAGGADPIAFSIIAEPGRPQIAALRAAAEKAAAREKELKQNPTAVKPDEQQKYSGQAFIVTMGAGNYKLGGVTVYVFPASAWSATETTVQPIFLPKPLAKVTTDADGRFEFTLPNGSEFFILAQSSRLAGGYTEEYEWCVRSSDLTNLPTILLSNGNHRSTRRSYRIDSD